MHISSKYICRASCDPDHSRFSKNFQAVMSLQSLGTCVLNLKKSVALTVLELLACNIAKFWGSHDPCYAVLKKFKGVMSGKSLEWKYVCQI